MRREDIIAKLKDLKIPEFENNPELLAELIGKIEQQAEEKANEDVDAFKDLAKRRIQNLDGVPIPLSKEESKTFDNRVKATLGRIKKVNAKIDIAEESIKNIIDKKDESLVVDISESRSLKKATRNVFGKKKNEITYEDYLELLKLRKEAIRSEKKSFKVKK